MLLTLTNKGSLRNCHSQGEPEEGGEINSGVLQQVLVQKRGTPGTNKPEEYEQTAHAVSNNAPVLCCPSQGEGGSDMEEAFMRGRFVGMKGKALALCAGHTIFSLNLRLFSKSKI